MVTKKREYSAIWVPQAGPQEMALSCTFAREILYGGTRGAGKTDTTIGRQITGAQEWGAQWNGLIVRNHYKQLAAVFQRFEELIASGLKATIHGTWEKGGIVRYENGAITHLRAVRFKENLDEFQGWNLTEVAIEEATNFKFIADMVDCFNACIRKPGPVPKCLFLTANPGGKGHSYVKQRYVDPAPEGYVPIEDERGRKRIFIKAKLSDNRILDEGDPEYRLNLEAIKCPIRRRAWLDGDWDIVFGNAFPDFQPSVHVIKPFEIPDSWTRFVGGDYGYVAPSCVHWGAIDGDGVLYIYREFYAARHTGNKLGAKVLELEGDEPYPRWRRFDPAIFAKKESERSIGIAMEEAGCDVEPADNDRFSGKEQVHERLHVTYDTVWNPVTKSYDTLPVTGVKIFDTAVHLIETLKSIPVDDDNIEDVDTDGDDHAYDSFRYLCMGYPILPNFHDVAKKKLPKRRDRNKLKGGWAI